MFLTRKFHYTALSFVLFLNFTSGLSTIRHQRNVSSAPHFQGRKPRAAFLETTAASLKLVGGIEVTPNEFPFQVFLSLQLDGREHHTCGASLIADKWILTAAHCVQGISTAQIVLGAHNIENSIHEIHRKQYESNHFYIHPDWNSETLENDIALIQLPVTVSYSRYIQPISLASPPDLIQVGDIVIITGWGLNYEDDVNSVLRKARGTIISNSDCSEYYDSLISDEMICTSGEDHIGSCKGDSGGRMFSLQFDGSWQQIGIVSFGASFGCQQGYPNGFTRVSSFIRWIENIIREENTYNRSAVTRLVDIFLFLLTIFSTTLTS